MAKNGDHPQCDCPGCVQGLEPFTVVHFRAWAYELELDTGGKWIVEDFQERFLEDLFRFIRERIPAECWLVIPEGNAKTTLIAGITLYVLEHFPNAGIPVGAPAKETADSLYLQAEGFVTRTPRLAESKPDLVLKAKGLEQLSPGRRKEIPRFACQEGFRRIKFWRGGRLQIRAADERTADGIIPAGIMVIDEAHRMKDMGLYRLWSGKGEKRQCVIVVISTAGEPGGEFEEIREQLRQGDQVTRDGCFIRSVSESAVLHEWSLPEDGDPEDLALVAAANPLSTVTEETLARKRRKKSWNLAHWRRLTCNLPTRSEFAAIQESEWYAAAISEDEWPLGERTWLGLDVGWKFDTTALVPLWIRDPEYRLLGRSRVLVPPRDGTSLDLWAVKVALEQEFAQNPFHTVVMDTSRAEDVAQYISEEFGVTVIDRAQTNTAAVEDYDRFLQALREGWLHHIGDPMLTRHVLNAIARVLPHGDVRFERPHQSRKGQEQDRRVIDALSAASMAHSLAHGELTMAGGLAY